MPRPLKRGILGASTIILSKDIDKYAFMCGSNFYETDVNWLNRLAKSWKLVKSNFCLFSNPVNSCTEVVIYQYSHLNLR